MNSYNEYFKRLNKIHCEKRMHEIEKLSFKYLNNITKEIQHKKNENMDIYQVSVNLGQCENYPYNISYMDVINNIKKNIMYININSELIDKTICEKSNSGFLGYYPKKCHTIRELILKVNWD